MSERSELRIHAVAHGEELMVHRPSTTDRLPHCDGAPMSVTAPTPREVATIATVAPVGGGSGRDAWKLVLPAMLPILLFSVYPLLRGIWLGFTDATAAATTRPTSTASRTTASSGATRCSGSRSASGSCGRCR